MELYRTNEGGAKFPRFVHYDVTSFHGNRAGVPGEACVVQFSFSQHVRQSGPTL
jgi:hypothetical protein